MELIKPIVTVECEKNESYIFLEEIKGDVWTNDPDDSMLARKFYTKFWSDILNKDIGCFRGETILSFNTIAGCMIRILSIYRTAGFSMPECGEKRLELITTSNEISKELKKKFIKFYSVYHTLANFMIFIKPNKYYKNNSPYLQYVKSMDYHEFPDLLLKDIYRFYETGGDGERSNPKFLKDTNFAYFKSFGDGLNGWKKFIESNYMQDYFMDDEYTNIIQLAPADDVDLPYNQTIARKICCDAEKKNRCIHAIDKFIDNAIIIIEKRAVTLSKYKK